MFWWAFFTYLCCRSYLSQPLIVLTSPFGVSYFFSREDDNDSLGESVVTQSFLATLPKKINLLFSIAVVMLSNCWYNSFLYLILQWIINYMKYKWFSVNRYNILLTFRRGKYSFIHHPYGSHWYESRVSLHTLIARIILNKIQNKYIFNWNVWNFLSSTVYLTFIIVLFLQSELYLLKQFFKFLLKPQKTNVNTATIVFFKSWNNYLQTKIDPLLWAGS